MHIVHVTTTFNSRSGSARRTHRVLRGCAAAGLRVSLVVGAANDLAAFDDIDYPVRVLPSLIKPVAPLRDLQTLLALRRELRTLRPDVIHTHLAKAGILARIAASACAGAAVVHTVHGPSFPPAMAPARRRLFLTLEKLAARRTDRFVFVGQELLEQYRRAGVAGADNSLVIRTARDDAELDAPPLRRDELLRLRTELCGRRAPQRLLLYVARIVPGKQIGHALDALRRLLDDGVDVGLAVVGAALVDGERRHLDELRTLAARLGVAERVWFSGYRRDVLCVMQAADAVLLTSQYEGLPNVAVEALLARTPLFSYPVSGVRELLPETFIVEPASARALAERLQWWFGLDDDARRRRRQELSEARRRVVRDYRAALMIEKKLALYRSLAARR